MSEFYEWWRGELGQPMGDEYGSNMAELAWTHQQQYIDKLTNTINCIRIYDDADDDANFDGNDHPIVMMAMEIDCCKLQIQQLEHALKTIANDGHLMDCTKTVSIAKEALQVDAEVSDEYSNTGYV